MKRVCNGLFGLFLSGCGLFGVGADGTKSPDGESSGDGGSSGGSKSGKAVRRTDVCVSSVDGAKSAIENTKAFGLSAAYGCETDEERATGYLTDWLTIQGMEGGRKAMSQLGLAELYIAHMTNSEGVLKTDDRFITSHHEKYTGMIGKLLDPTIMEEQIASAEDGDKAYVRERVRFALEIRDVFKAFPPDDDFLGRWVEQVDKEREIFRTSYEIRVATGASTPWKLQPIAACKKAKDIFFKIAPQSEAMNANELTKRFNTMPRLALLEDLVACGYLQGLPGEGDGFAAIVDEVKNTARYDTVGFPGGDAPTKYFIGPFSRPKEVYGEPVRALRLPDVTQLAGAKCWGGSQLISSAQFEEEYSGGWGEVTSVKETDKGVLVTFKKHSWMTDKVECLKDGGAPWFNGVSWQSSRTCKVVGREQATHQEPPTYFPKDAAKEIKPGRMMSFVHSSSAVLDTLSCQGKDAKAENFGFPVFVHTSGGNELKKDDQAQYFYWPVKREAAQKPAKK